MPRAACLARDRGPLGVRGGKTHSESICFPSSTIKPTSSEAHSGLGPRRFCRGRANGIATVTIASLLQLMARSRTTEGAASQLVKVRSELIDCRRRPRSELQVLEPFGADPPVAQPGLDKPITFYRRRRRAKPKRSINRPRRASASGETAPPRLRTSPTRSARNQATLPGSTQPSAAPTPE